MTTTTTTTVVVGRSTRAPPGGREKRGLYARRSTAVRAAGASTMGCASNDTMHFARAIVPRKNSAALQCTVHISSFTAGILIQLSPNNCTGASQSRFSRHFICPAGPFFLCCITASSCRRYLALHQWTLRSNCNRRLMQRAPLPLVSISVISHGVTD